MMRYKQNNSYQPTEELSHKTLLSDSSDKEISRSNTPNRKHSQVWTYVSLILVAVLLVATVAAGFFFLAPAADPAAMEYQMYAKQVSATGILLDEGSFTFTGSLLRYPGNWKNDVVDITQLSVIGNEFNKSSMTYTVDEQTGSTVLQGNNWLIEIGAKGDWCVIRTYSEYYVCSTSENFDPQEILALSTCTPA